MRSPVIAAAALALVTAGSAVARTIEGTPSRDRLTGTPRADAVFGRGGGDRLAGIGGADFLHGGPGRDVLEAGPGNDRIVAQYDGGRDSVRCGPGLDLVNADLLDVVSADCELVGRRLSRDPYTNAASQHETQVEPDSLTVGRTTVATYQVGRRHDGAADNIGFSVSNDDGRTWRSGLLPALTVAGAPPGPNTRASDPVVAYDATNRVWLIATLAIQDRITRLTVSRSADGFTWSPPVVAIEAATDGDIAFDKEWIACDNAGASAFGGRCYLVYTDTQRSDRLAVITSLDGGLTWSAPVGIPVTNAVGAFPVIRPNGELVVVTLLGTRRLGASVSADGGLSFGPATTVAEIEYRSIRGLRFFPLPSADVDPTGRVWVSWHDCGFSTGCSSNDVVVSTSADGRTWSPPRRVTTGRNAFLPAIGIHPGSGRVAIVYFLVRASGGIDVELVESRVAASGFAGPRRLSAQTMQREWLPDTASGRMLADYLSVHYAGVRPLALWVLASEPVGSSFRQAIFATKG
jgi:RTX calcium-binding nonapeptide repeat (4 copies)